MILPSIDLITSPDLGYLRAHGRNAPGYIRKRTVAGRFNYDYSRTELEKLADRTVRLVRQVSEMHVVYNNNKADYAPRAAATFQEILHAKHLRTLPETLRENSGLCLKYYQRSNRIYRSLDISLPERAPLKIKKALPNPLR